MLVRARQLRIWSGNLLCNDFGMQWKHGNHVHAADPIVRFLRL